MYRGPQVIGGDALAGGWDTDAFLRDAAHSLPAVLVLVSIPIRPNMLVLIPICPDTLELIRIQPKTDTSTRRW